MGLSLIVSNRSGRADAHLQWTDLLEGLLQIAGRQVHIRAGEVDLMFVDDEEIRGLNKDYRGVDKATDVLSFPMLEYLEEEPGIVFAEEDGAPPPDLLGDIVISVPRAEEQARDYGHSLEREIGFLFVHGFLHLIGYDHQDEAAEIEMFAKQEHILQEAGLVR